MLPLTEAAPQQPPTKEQIIAKIQAPLLRLLTDLGVDDDHERRAFINRARRNWKMVKGEHFLYPDWIEDDGEEIADWVSLDSTDDGGAAERFCYPINLIGSDCRKYVSILGRGVPGVKGIPDDLESQEMTDAARSAGISMQDLVRRWKMKQRQKRILFHQFTTGPAFIHTPYNTDKRKYGITSVPSQELDPLTGEVIEGEPTTYENGDAECRVYSILEVAVPFARYEIGECEWLRCQVNTSKWRLIQRYEKLAAHRDDDLSRNEMRSSSTQAGVEAADAVHKPGQVGKATKKNNWLLSQWWIDPSEFEAIKEEDVRELLKKLAPNGLKSVWVGDILCDFEHEHHEETWSVCKVGQDAPIMENPLCHDAVPIQRAVNDVVGLTVETILRGIPKTVIDQGVIDRKSLSENEPTPYEAIFTTRSGVGDLRNSIVPFPMARLSEQTGPFTDQLRNYFTEMTSVRPELSGGGPPTQTFREAKQRRDQALAILSDPMDAYMDALGTALENGTKQRARHGSGPVKAQKQDARGKVTTETVRMEELSETGWHAEVEEGIPMSYTERSDRLFSLLREYPPEVQQALSLMDPINVELVIDLLQLPGFRSPVAEARRRLLSTIEQLMREAPNPDGSPSIMPDPDVDDPAFQVPEIIKWCNSSDGTDAELASAEGFANVKAYLRAQKMAQQAAMMAMQPPPPGQDQSQPKADGGGPPAEQQETELPPPGPLTTEAPTVIQ